MVRARLRYRLKLNAGGLRKYELCNFIGPFCRCINVFVPEWVPIIDIRDITFHVTQDISGDGVEERIYSQGFFSVRWDNTNLPPVKLIASSTAISSLESGEIIDIACSDMPAIYRAGRMPVRVDATMYVPVAGYALRPNSPHPSGNPADALLSPDAQSPFFGVVRNYGCLNLATWRVVHLIAREDGPFDVIVTLRLKAGESFVGRLMDCPYCLSLWIAVPFVFMLANDFVSGLAAWLAISGGASALERGFERTNST